MTGVLATNSRSCCSPLKLTFTFNLVVLFLVGILVLILSFSRSYIYFGYVSIYLDIKVVDLLGKETKIKKNKVLLYIYDDGSVDKKIIR